MQVNIYEAKTRLSELIGLLEKEEEIVIAKSGKPVAKLVPYQNPQHRELGAWKGAFTVPEDFDDPDEEIAECARKLQEKGGRTHTCFSGP